jgi:hypothetical protein
LAALLAVASVGCSDPDTTVGPEPDPPGPPVIESFFATATGGDIQHGEFTQLRWRASGGTTSSIDDGSASVGALPAVNEGSLSVRPYRSVTYTLTVRNNLGTVTATADVAVNYPSATFVDAIAGDDTRTGDSPATAIRTLDEAVSRAQGAGGFIFLSGGDFPTNITMDGASISIYGGLNPTTFFEEPATWQSVIRPASGIPIEVRNVTQLVEFRNLLVDAQGGGEVAVDIDNARVEITHCHVDGDHASSGTAIRIAGGRPVTIRRCQIFGGREAGTTTYSATRGIQILGAPTTVSNCFVDGGKAVDESSGIDIDVPTHVGVGVGLCTISADSRGTIGSPSAASIRIRQGHPAIGGNILLTEGSGDRVGIFEMAPDASPDWLERNVFVGMGVPPYRNADGLDPDSETELNDADYTTGRPLQVWDNLLLTGIAPSSLFTNLSARDYHLVPFLPSMQPNPAVDAGEVYLANARYGGIAGVEFDVDGDRRPTSGASLDLGADEY